MLTAIEKKLKSDGYVFVKEFHGNKIGAVSLARGEREKGNLARVLNPRSLTHEVWVKEKALKIGDRVLVIKADAFYVSAGLVGKEATVISEPTLWEGKWEGNGRGPDRMRVWLNFDRSYIKQQYACPWCGVETLTAYALGIECLKVI